MTRTNSARTADGTTGSAATTMRGPRRPVHIALWVLQVMTAGVFVVAAIPKITADPQAVAGFADMGLGTTAMYIIGALELAGAVALLIPRLAGSAGLAFVALMIGAIITTLLVDGPGMVALPATVLVLAAIIGWGRRRSTADLVALLRRH